MKYVFSFLSILAVCDGAIAFEQNMFQAPVFKPVVSFPEIKPAGFIQDNSFPGIHTSDEMVIATAPVMPVAHIRKQNLQLSSAGTPALNMSNLSVRSEILMPKKPNIQYAGQTAFVSNMPIEETVKPAIKKQSVAQKPQSKKQAKALAKQNAAPFVLPYKNGKTIEKSSVLPKGKLAKIKHSVNLKHELQKTYVSENKYLTLLEGDNTLPNLGMDQGFGTADNMEMFGEPQNVSNNDTPPAFVQDQSDSLPPLPTEPTQTTNVPVDLSAELAAFSEESSDMTSGAATQPIEVLQMKISFNEEATSVNATNLDLITSFAQVLQNDPTNGVEIRISDEAMRGEKEKKIAAKRLAIISQILRDQGLKEGQIKPVLSKREFDSITLRIINLDSHKNLSHSKKDLFGRVIEKRSHHVMEW